MTSGAFDHSAIWSRTKIWRRKVSSVVWASAIRSDWEAVAIVGSSLGAVCGGGQRVDLGDAHEVVDRHPLGDRVLPAGPRPVRDRRHAAQGAKGVAVVDERLHADRQRGPRGRLIRLLEGRDEKVVRV